MKNSLLKVKDAIYCFYKDISINYLKKQKYTPSTFYDSHGGIDTIYEESEKFSIHSNPSYDRRRIP